MNKPLLILIVILGFVFSANAQRISKNAIGLRLGDSDGFGTEINYQLGLNESNRIEFGLSWHSVEHANAFRLTGLYQWVWVLDGNLNWYAGAGGGVAQINFDKDYNGNYNDETIVFAAGDVGIEYNFDFPLLLSLDVRPEIGFGDYWDDFNFDLALGIRYQF